MLTEPPHPPFPPDRPPDQPPNPPGQTASAPAAGSPPAGDRPLRRGADQPLRRAPGLASASVSPGGGAAAAPASAVSGTGRPASPAVRWPLPAVALVLAGSAAALAASAGWLLVTWLAWPAAWAAAAAAALALLVAAVPALALLLSQAAAAVRPADAPAGAEAAPVRDPDTGAYRRDLFMELAEREWARARRYGTGAGLLVVDLDRSAQLQDAHGPAAADAFLTALTEQTSPTLRGADLITRLAPTQLGVFLAHADATGALDVAERIRERAEQLDLPWPAAAGDQATRLRASVSVGVASLRPAHLNLQALVHDVEDALVTARQAGGNCVRAAPVDDGASAPPGAWRNDHRTRPQ